MCCVHAAELPGPKGLLRAGASVPYRSASPIEGVKTGSFWAEEEKKKNFIFFLMHKAQIYVRHTNGYTSSLPVTLKFHRGGVDSKNKSLRSFLGRE